MLRRPHRVASLVLAALAALAGLAAPSSTAEAEEAPPAPPVRASMQCDRAAEPGRVKCSVEARIDGAAPGAATRTIAWADVTLIALPELAAALKGRIGREDATARDPAAWRWAFALVAKKPGQGEARARVRLVICDGPGATRCKPMTIDVHTIVSVGA